LELTGNLKDFTIEDLLKFINLSKRTGVIYIKGNVEKKEKKREKSFVKMETLLTQKLAIEAEKMLFMLF